MSQQYERINWVNETTRLNADNLNKMDMGIEQASKDIVDLHNTVNDGFENIGALTNLEIEEIFNSTT